MREADRLTISGVIVNAILFILKAVAVLASGSLAIASDALNSLLDILSYTLIYFAVKISRKKADETHQFGHHRAEPIAALVTAILAGILGFEVTREAIIGLLDHKSVEFVVLPIAVLVIAMAAKAVMSHYYLRVGKRLNSPAILAGSVDSFNDVLVSAVAVVGYMGGNYLAPEFDELAAILIGGWILRSGYKMAAENIDYLMGKSPGGVIVEQIRSRAVSVDGVIGLNTVRAHYVGNYIHVEVHINVNKNLSTEDSHAISKRVQHAIEDLPQITHAFIHIDPS